MNRERALQVVIVLVGLLFVAAIYPMGMSLWHPSPSDDTGDTMMMSLYFTLGAFLLVASRKPSAHRSLIAYTARFDDPAISFIRCVHKKKMEK